MDNSTSDTHQLLARAAEGDQSAWEALVRRYSPGLRRGIAGLIGPRARSKVDPEDVLQAGWMAAFCRLPEFVRKPGTAFRLWITGLTRQAYWDIRRALRTKQRDADREVGLGAYPPPQDEGTSPSGAASRAERAARVRRGLAPLKPHERAILEQRHFQQMSFAEIAATLQINEDAARKRYNRALEHLMKSLAGMPGGLNEVAP
jgi:RNA polymerase sigma-70 factor (ECF subfamily)